MIGLAIGAVIFWSAFAVALLYLHRKRFVLWEENAKRLDIEPEGDDPADYCPQES